MATGGIRVLSRLVPLLDAAVDGYVVFSDRYGDPNSFLRCCAKPPRWSLVLKSDPEFSCYSGTLAGVLQNLPKTPGTITVVRLGAGTCDVMLQTHKATVIECLRADATPAALFSRHFSDDTWVMTSSGDQDWDSELMRLGYSNASSKPKNLQSEG